MYDVCAFGELLICLTHREQMSRVLPCLFGAPANVLAMMSKLGGKTAFIGKTGDDEFGRFLEQTLACMGIDTGGLMNSAQVMSTTFSFGRGWETDVISAVVIGGTSMTGGIGKVWGTMVGILFFGVLINGMTILNISVYMQYVVRAIMLFSAILLSLFLPKLRQKL
jgi:predicted ABC-type sugar transport system permease subunit